MGALAVIPARLGSTRLPAKPLRLVGGVPVIVRVVRQVLQADRVSQVIVATDHHTIGTCIARSLTPAQAARAPVMMTSPACRNGTERVLEVATRLRGSLPDVILNVQGDEPFICPSHIDTLVDAVGRHTDVATLADAGAGGTTGADDADTTHCSVVRCVVNEKGNAMYFSRSPLVGAMRHIGVYAFSAKFLTATLPALQPCSLEEKENIEQLRWLYRGATIKVCVVDGARPGIDTESDLEEANRWCTARGI